MHFYLKVKKKKKKAHKQRLVIDHLPTKSGIILSGILQDFFVPLRYHIIPYVSECKYYDRHFILNRNPSEYNCMCVTV